ncbi:MAG TPA: hypothetical protein VMT35_13855 [Ignavibacteriaceae bacterium]|nr:hypothetical protein [Ignavibacteriaceae bacterium]
MQIYKYRVLIGKWEKLGKFGKLEAGSWMLDTGLDAGLDSGCRPATA